jgi:hypothetical protein
MTSASEENPDPRIREAGAGSESVSPAPRSEAQPMRPLPESDEEFDSVRRGPTMPRAEDVRHVDLLSTFYFVVAGLTALCGTVPFAHLFVGISIASGGMKGSGPPPPAAIGRMFIGVACALIAYMWTSAICMVVTGFCLRRRKGYVFCLVTAGIACLHQPFGIVLGIFTFIILFRPGVKKLFGRATQVLG